MIYRDDDIDERDGMVYHINESDQLVFLSDNWNHFAEKNAGAPLDLLGQTIWDFIANDDLIAIYQEICHLVRKEQKPVSFDFRCDSPRKALFLKMNILPLENQYLEFRTQPIHEEAHAYYPLLDSKAPRQGELMRICSNCKALWVNDRWLALDEAVAVLQLLQQKNVPQLTHGLCECCYQTFREEIVKLHSAAG